MIRRPVWLWTWPTVRYVCRPWRYLRGYVLVRFYWDGGPCYAWLPWRTWWRHTHVCPDCLYRAWRLNGPNGTCGRCDIGG